MTGKRLKILFVIRAVEHYPYIRSIVEETALRGHKLNILFDKKWSSKKLTDLEGKSGIKFGWGVRDPTSWRQKLCAHCRNLLSWQRYYHNKNQSAFYRQRWERDYFFKLVSLFLKVPGGGVFLSSVLVERILQIIEKLISPDRAATFAMKKFRPDVVVATPGNLPYLSVDSEYLKAAKHLKIPTVISVFSWDNLTTKGLFNIEPDLLLVWNKTQIVEAKRHHGISKKKVRVIGAPLFDHWFKKRDVTSRRDFCKKYELNPVKPVFLYLETSDSLTGDERWLVERLMNTFRSGWQLVVRPHPFKTHFSAFKHPNVIVIPKAGTWPNSDDAIQLYADCIYHSVAVFGVNTSGFIDSIIFDKPTIALVTENYRNTQVKTEHFAQLVREDALYAIGVDGVRRTVDRILVGADKRSSKRIKFVNGFIRPNSLGVSAGEAAMAEIEKL